MKDKSLYMKQFEIFPSLDNWTTNFSGLMDDEDLSKLLSNMISESVPALLEEYRVTINKTVSPIIIEQANKFLANKTIGDIIGKYSADFNPIYLLC